MTSNVDSISHANDHRLLESLSVISTDHSLTTSQPQHSFTQPRILRQSHQHLLQQQQLHPVQPKPELLANAVQSHLPKLGSGVETSGSGLMTVFNSNDGTLSLSLETARSLGIDVGPIQQVSSCSTTMSASPGVVVNNASLLPSSMSSDGTVTYILRSAPAVTWFVETRSFICNLLLLGSHHISKLLKSAQSSFYLLC